jgi:hypothetical protein
VTVRDDLAAPQALKTQIHELAHVLMHGPEVAEAKSQGRIEVEAESVAYVVCDLLGVDAGEYSIPYVASWAAGDAERVQQTAHAVLGTARRIVAGIESELGVDLRPNPIADALAARQAPTQSMAAERPPVIGTTDQIIFHHIVAGAFDWNRLAASIPAIDHWPGDIAGAATDHARQATILAEAGASAHAAVEVLRAQQLDDAAVRGHLSVNVRDAAGQLGPLFHPHDVFEALKAPRPDKPLADKMVADLLVAAGKHPAAARHLAETSGQPSNVVNLIEERLRRAGHPVTAGLDRRSERGLRLIDEWTSDGPVGAASPEPVTQAPPPEGPQPAA